MVVLCACAWIVYWPVGFEGENVFDRENLGLKGSEAGGV